MSDPYHAIYQGEIFQASQCIWHENNLMDFFRSNLMALGYESGSDNRKVWHRGSKTVVVCLVDDFETCSTQYQKTLPYKFDTNTVVITDNWISVPTQYQVCQLPASFFGIYHHVPQLQTWQPDRRFNFSVNRIDPKRLLMLLEIYYRGRSLEVNTDYINFNCWHWQGNNSNKNGLRQNFLQVWQQLGETYHKVYEPSYQQLLDQMPLKTYDCSHEHAHSKSYCNLVMETYSSDTTVALSEKTFRALCLPVPWQIYAGKCSVAYLHRLGFDVLSDLITHDYDLQIENRTAAYGDKMVDFLWQATDNVNRWQQQDFGKLQQRLVTAAQHNQQRLLSLKKSWPQDFAAWWVQTLEHLI